MNKRLWLLRIVTLVSLALTLRAGFWQLDRAAQREAAQERLQTQAQASELDNVAVAAALTPTPAAQPGSPAWQDRRVRLRGHWLPEQTVYLDNRAMDGAAGFFVTTPLRLDGSEPVHVVDTSGTGLHAAAEPTPDAVPAAGSVVRAAPAGPVIWVQRGWVPRNLQDRTRLPSVPTPAEQVQVEGRLAPALSQVYALGADSSGPIRQNLTLAQMQTMVSSPLLGAVVVQTGPTRDGLLRNWPPPASGAAKNRGYAVQWFGMAGLILVLYVWFQFLRPLIRRRAVSHA